MHTTMVNAIAVVLTDDGNARIYYKDGVWEEFSPITDNRLQELRSDDYNHDYYMNLWKDAVNMNQTNDSFDDYVSLVKQDLFDENDDTDFPNKTYEGEFERLGLDDEIKQVWKYKFGERIITWDYLDSGYAYSDEESKFIWKKVL